MLFWIAGWGFTPAALLITIGLKALITIAWRAVATQEISRATQ